MSDSPFLELTRIGKRSFAQEQIDFATTMKTLLKLSVVLWIASTAFASSQQETGSSPALASKESSLNWGVASTTTALASQGVTWYVRADGAPHYSPNIANLPWRGLDPKHTCDGTHDSAWPAVGTVNALGNISDGQNQPCALSDYRWLYDDQGSYGQLKWIIAGGDTVILDNTKAWRVGWDGDGSNYTSEPWCWGWNGGPFGCFNPPIPAGTAQQHTRILGRNWANCSVGTQPDKTKMSELFGGHGVGTTLNLAGAQFVDVQCVNITRHSQCIAHGDDPNQKGCQRSYPLDDYDGSGIWTGTGTHDVLLQDIWDHGHTDRGIIGPIGGLVTATRVDIDTNGMAGWDFDDGNSTPSVNGVLKMNYSTVEFSGCNQEYPAVHAIPVLSCFGQSNGGYGDGIGTPSGNGMDVYVDNSIFRYNTQDGPDFVHIDTGQHTFKFTNNQSYGNGGAQLKFGAFASVEVTNNVLIANCLRMSADMPGVPSGYNSHLGDFCRAYNGVGFGIHNGAQVTFANNTLVGYAPTLFDPACTDATCESTVFTFSHNIVRGYDDPQTYGIGGKGGGPGLFCGYQCDNTSVPLGTFNRDHNLYYGTSNDHQANQATGYATHETYTNELSIDPKFVGEPARFTAEADLDNYNTTLASDSPANGLGASIPYTPTSISPVTPVAPVTPVTSAPYVIAVEQDQNISVASGGGGSPLAAKAIYSDGKTYTTALTYVPADPSVGSIINQATGEYRGLKAGSTTVQACYGNICSSNIQVSIISAPATTIPTTPAPTTPVVSISPESFIIIMSDGSKYGGTFTKVP